jgi:hypothetical protein
MLRYEGPGAIPMRSVLLRPTCLVAVVFALVLTIALGGLSLFTWLEFKRIESIRAHVNRTSLFQESLVILKDLQVEVATTGHLPGPAKLRTVREDLAQILIKSAPVRSYMPKRTLNHLLTQLSNQRREVSERCLW